MSSKPRILIVDDDEQVLSALVRVLRKDFEIQFCTSAQHALEEINNNSFHIVLCDQNLGDDRGLNVFRKIRHTHPQMVRVLLSGQIDTHEISEALKDQLVHRFFVKPWDNEILRLQLLECAQLYGMMQTSITDPVTQLSNRRHFEDKLKNEVERAKRHGRTVSLLMIDVDQFKKINDDYGHQAGDLALQNVAKTLLQSVRNIDNVSRFGGDELAVILPETKLTDAFLIAERIRQTVLTIALPGPKGSLPLSISIGVSSLPEHGSETETLIGKADEALLLAKKQGRNKTVIAPQ